MAGVRQPYRLTLNGTYIVPTTAGLLQLLGWLLLLAASLNFNLGVMLLLTLMLGALALVCMVETVRNLAGVEVTVVPPALVASGGQAEFVVILQPTDRRPRPGLRLALTPSGHLRGWRNRLGLTALPLCQRIDLGPSGATCSFPLPADGRGTLPPVRILLTGTWPLGLFRAWRSWQPAAEGVVHPQPDASRPARSGEAAALAEDAASMSPSSADFASESAQGDFCGHRRREPFDPLRRIDWRASLRSGRMLVARRDPDGAAAPVSLRWEDHAPAAPELRLARLASAVLLAAGARRHFSLELPGAVLAAGTGAQHRDQALALLAQHPEEGPDALIPQARLHGAELQPRQDEGVPPATLLYWTVSLFLAALPLATQLHADAWLPWLALLATRLWLIRSGGKAPGTLWLSAGALAAAAWIFTRYHTLIGRESGMALLQVMAGLKLLEVRRDRDLHMLCVLALFLLLSAHFQTQSPWLAVWDVGVCALLADGLLAAQQAGPPRQRRRTLLRMALPAIPLAILLFVLLPRPENAFWGMARSDEGLTGSLSDHMSPGSVSRLRLSERVAFRVHFAGKWPASPRLYWRGPVLDRFDGQTWSAVGLMSGDIPVDPGNETIDYEYEAEPGEGEWIFALELPESGDREVSIDGEGVTRAAPAFARQHSLHLRAHLDARLETGNAPLANALDLEVPPGNPQTRALALPWRTLPVRERIAAAKQALLDAHLQYSLDVPPAGQDPVDDLLFHTGLGYCEHFASAFAVMLRLAGVPARVVTGYQGGERNPVGDYLIVRQQDAHAWVEAWVAGAGWIRIDPTALAVPLFLTGGTQAAAPLPQPAWMPGFARAGLPLWHRLSLLRDAAAMRWQRDIANLNASEQRALLAELGLGGVDKGQLAAWCALLISAALAAQLAHSARRSRQAARPSADGSAQADPAAGPETGLDPAQPVRQAWRRNWELGCRVLALAGLARAPGEGPLAYRDRLATHPTLAPAILAWSEPGVRGIYGAPAQVLDQGAPAWPGQGLAALALAMARYRLQRSRSAASPSPS